MNSAIVLCVIISIVLTAAHQYDNNSCKTLLPVTKRAADLWRNTSDRVDSVAGDPVSSEETSADQDDDEDEENEDAPIDLVPALERSPFKIETSSLKYRRNRVMTIKIEGSKLNGLLLQARQRFPSSLSNRPIFVGNFIDMPEGFQTMDCNPEESPYQSNTVFNTHQRTKTGVKLNWKAPRDNFDSIEFLATVIRGKYYWTHVKSMPLFFNEFPPSFTKCGKERSCHQHVRNPNQCADGFCRDYVLMFEVSDNHVTFFIGGNVEGDTGYVGIAFTNDKEKLSILDLSVCRRKDQRTVDVINYKINKSIGHMVRQSDFASSVTYDIEGDYIWCSFRLPLKNEDDKAGLDLSKEQFYILIRGYLDSITTDPFLQNDEDMVKEVMRWTPTATSNTINYYGSSNVASLSWALIIAICITNLINLTK